MADWATIIGGQTTEQVLQTAFERLAASGSRITNLNVGGVFRTFLELASQGIGDLYALLLAVVPKGYLAGAEGHWLDAKAADLGLVREPALATQGLVRFARDEPGPTVEIDAGLVLRTPLSDQAECVSYKVRERTMLPAGALSVLVPVEAMVAGSRGNVAAGLITECVTAVSGVDHVTNEADWITRAGVDAESDAHLRERCMLRWYELSRGATRDAYVAWARAVVGVADVRVDDHFPRGDGTVDVIVTGAGGAPGPDLVAAVQAHIDARRPLCADVLVRGPVLVPVHVRVLVYLPPDEGDEEEVRAAIAARYDELLSSGAVPAQRLGIGRPLWLTRLASIAMAVSPVQNVEVQSPVDDVVPDPDGLVCLADVPEVLVDRLEA